MSSARLTPAKAAWSVGVSSAAAIFLVLGGVFQFLQGLAALLNSEFSIVGANYTFSFDLTTWGWIQIILGIIVLAAGVGVITGQLWGRVVGITIATLTMLTNFAFIPYYPIWSLVIIALNVFVIWALCVYDRDTAAAAG